MTYNDIALYLFEDIAKVNKTSICELRYVLRDLFCRGLEEAHFRYMLSDGEKAQAYRHLKLMLLRVFDDLEAMITEDGLIVHQHRAVLCKALVYVRYLIAIEREETASQFEMLENQLRIIRSQSALLRVY